jgi:P27 family predicted phage terminase small subunit
MPSALDPPADLDAEARAIWVDTLAHIMEAGTLQRLDVHSLSAYVQAVRNHQRASRYLAASDVLLERGGQAIANPALTVQQQAARTIATFAKQFRLTAAAPQAAPGEQPAIEAARPSKDHLGTWCDEHTRWECHAPKTRGRGPCHKLAEPPDGRCSFHGGGDFKVKNLAAKLEREPTYGAPVQTSAEQVLVRRLWARAGHVKWLGERVAELEAAALTWGTDQTVERWWGEFPGSETVHRAGPHVLLDL